jgi:hypothetical protein
MPEVIPPPAIVAARSVSAFISANSDIDEVLAPLARVPDPRALSDARWYAGHSSLNQAYLRLRRSSACGWAATCLPRGPRQDYSPLAG